MVKNIPAKAGSKYGDLYRRLIFLVLALVVYRIGTHIPVPGIDPDTLKELFNQQQGGILGLFNMFSGGALSRFSVFALGKNEPASVLEHAGLRHKQSVRLQSISRGL